MSDEMPVSAILQQRVRGVKESLNRAGDKLAEASKTHPESAELFEEIWAWIHEAHTKLNNL